MTYDVTLIRFMVLTAQDQDHDDRNRPDLVRELSHWFKASEVRAHRRLFYSARIMTDPDLPGGTGLSRLTRTGARLATCLRDEADWRDAIPPHNPPTAQTFRAIIARALRQRRTRARAGIASLQRALAEATAVI